MNKTFKMLVVIGRMQPEHRGHESIIEDALDKAEHVLLLVGGANSAPSVKNPFDVDTLMDAIKLNHNNSSLIVSGINNFRTNEEWIHEVKSTIESVMENEGITEGRKGLVVFRKDKSSFYLDYADLWGLEEYCVSGCSSGGELLLSATEVREVMWSGHLSFLRGVLSPFMYDMIRGFVKTPLFDRLKSEYKTISKTKSTLSHLEFPYTAHAGDAVVRHGNEILMIRRGGVFGNGLLALPGGYIDNKETVLDGALRELAEETNIALSVDELKSYIVGEKRFDDPERSQAYRIITTAFFIDLPIDIPKPNIKAGDDARSAEWISIHKLTSKGEYRKEVYSDHPFILDYFLKERQDFE